MPYARNKFSINLLAQKLLKNVYEIDPCGLFHKHAYQQLLCTQIPEAQKYSQVICVFLRFWNLHV